MSEDEELRLREWLSRLRQEHRDLDGAIAALESQGGSDMQIRRLKKQKLTLKDRILRLEQQFVPDIIA